MYMIFWILQRISISLVLIACAHYIYIFLKHNLTIPKTRDLVNQPREKYKEMYKKINQGMYTASSVNGDKTHNEAKSTNVQSKMKNELKNYLKDLKKSNNTLSNSSNTNNSSLSTNQSPVSDGSTIFNSALSDSGFSNY